MNIDSPELRTDLIFHRELGVVRERDEYLALETPSEPYFYYGNLLHLARPPRAGELDRWRARFAAEFAHRPEVRHETFRWDVRDGDEGDVSQFVGAGFEAEWNVALLASAVSPPPHPNPDVTVRAVERDEDWEAMAELQTLHRSPGWGEGEFREHLRQRTAMYRRLAAAGRGGWHGAYLGGRLVGDLGLFWDGDMARFQAVGTHPDFRRRGVCGTLVFEVSRRALEAGVRTLVIVADEHYHAARVYGSVGFRPGARTVGVCRRPEASAGR